MDGIVRQSRSPVLFGDLVGENGTRGAVYVPDLEFTADRFCIFKRRLGGLQQLPVEYAE